MPRALRIEYPGAAYHVMARGNQGRAIFEDDKDRQRFLETLGGACAKTGWRVHAYVLMGNHYHLLVETPEANLVAGMKWLQGTYTQRYNRRHEVFGHLFQGRYKAMPVEATHAGYWEVVSTYIHLNPARAGLIEAGKERLKGYRWSSYPWYLTVGGRGPEWLHRERVMESLGLAPEDRRGYESYIEGRVLEIGMQAGRGGLEEQWRQMRRGWYVGGEGFFGELRNRLEKAVRGRRRESHSGAARQAHDELAAEKMLQTGLKALGLKMEALKAMRKGAPEKVALAWWLRERTTASLRWVGERLRMGHSGNVSQGARKLRRTGAQKLKQLKSVLEQISEKEQ
jgi:REP element-mobilizing transposase RayT